MRGEVHKRGKNWYYHLEIGMHVNKYIRLKDTQVRH